MSHRLSRKLSPKAKKLLLTESCQHEKMSFLIRVSPDRSVEEICRAIRSLDGKCRTVLEETDLLIVELEAGKLSTLAQIEGVVYIEPATPYSL